MEALRREGVDARMLVAEKLSESPYIACAASAWRLKIPFLSERLKIFLANGLDRSTLFKIDTASDGVNLSRHPWVAEADVICLNWINQGMLSFEDIRSLIATGKPLVWTMHDMWSMTGICHHAGECSRFREECGECPLMGKRAGVNDLSRKIWRRKDSLFRGEGRPIQFVAVSRWLAERAAESSLLRNMPVEVIPNAFHIKRDDVEEMLSTRPKYPRDKIQIVFGASRLDDTVKGFPILIEATKALRSQWPEHAARLELVMFGGIKNPSLLNDIAINHRYLGVVHGEDKIRQVYRDADIVVSTSFYETLPGTLVEGQANGCIPVSFTRGGQRDIVSHLHTGYLADWSDDIREAGERIAEGIIWASAQGEEIRRDMAESVMQRFSAKVIADEYIGLFDRLMNDNG